MTKEDLYNELANCETEYGFTPTDVLNMLNVFFESNVVIPKGKNPHPYADVLHQWVEGIDVQYYNGFGEWITIQKFQAKQYRIKPSEPVLEFLWKYPSHEFDATTDKYLTAEEVETIGIKFWCKTETKRVRQYKTPFSTGDYYEPKEQQ